MLYQVLLFVLCVNVLSAQEHVQPAQDASKEQLLVETSALKAEAAAHEAAGRFSDARAAYKRVLILDPSDFETKRKVHSLALEHPGLGNSYFVQQQLITVEAQVHLARAAAFREKHQVQEALDELDYAEALHKRSTEALSQGDLLHLHELRIALYKERQEYELVELEKRRLENQRQMVIAVEKNELRERNIFEQRLARVTKMVRAAHYERALSLCRNLIKDYPGNEIVDDMFVHVVDLAHQQRQLNFDESMENIKREIRHQMHEVLIPFAWDGIPRYPDDWETRINNRKLDYYSVDLPDWQVALQDKIAERTTVHFEEQDIGDALDFLSTRLGVNIVVDPDIRASGSLVNIQARNMTIENILSWLARQVDSQWQFYNEAIYFGASQEKEVITRVYDVGQLVYNAPDFPGVELALANSASDGGGLFQDDFGDSEDGIAPEDLIDLLQATVDPTGWEDNDDWGVRVRGTMLMISASAETHILIREFIHGLRDMNDLLINISTQWVTVSDLFVEEIGVNWLNEGRIAGVVDEAIHSERPNGADDDYDFGINVDNVLPTSAVTTANTIINRGLRLDFAILNAIQAVAVFEAVQFKEKARILEQIELSVHNGARANAFVGNSIAYISDYDVQSNGVGNGQVSLLDPVIDVLSVGAALDIRPFASSDRKYVSLDLRPAFTTVEFDIANIVALQQLPSLAAELTMPIELPIVRVKQARTRVMIPDRGTLLAGGFGEHIEQNSYAQIPVLGNLPFIGRLFGRRAIRESRRSLYLTVTAKIIMYSELETLQ